MTETDGCALLRTLFEAAGHRIVPDHPFDEDGVRVTLDGFDPQTRVGFEYVTAEARDRHEFTPEVVEALEARMAKGELFLLLLDEEDVDEATMRFAAERFLAQVAGARR